MAAGSIVIDLLLKTGSFETDTKRAEKSLRQLKKEAEQFGRTIGAGLTAAAALGIAAVTGLAFAFDGLVKSAAAFKDIEETTGGSAEGFASLAIAAAGAGVGMDSIASASVRMTKGLVGVDDESKAVGAALKALNLSISDFKKLDPIQQYEAVGKALAGFSDGAGKTAVAVALFGKSGAEQLKVFKQLEEQGGRQVILTQAQIELADKYADAQAISAQKLKLYAQTIATDALPAVIAFQDTLIDLIKELVRTGGAADALTKQNAVRLWAQDAALGVASFIDSLIATSDEIRRFVATTKKEFATLKVIGQFLVAPTDDIGLLIRENTGPLRAALDERNKVTADAQKVLTETINGGTSKFRDALKKQFDALDQGLTGERLTAFNDPRSLTFGQTPPKKPKLVFDGTPTKGATDDPTKKLLDNELKAIEQIIKREQDLLSDRNKFLNIFNDQGLISIRSYYESQQAIIDAATSSQAAAYDKQIAVLRAFQANSAKATDRADAQGKINDIIEKRSRLEQESGQRGIELAIKQAEEERKLAQQIQGLSANVLELQGNLSAAAAIRFDQQNFDLVRRLTAEGNTAALALVDTLRKATIAQSDFAKASADSQRVVDSLANSEDRIAISRQLGATTELGALQQLGVARQGALAQMEAMVQAQEAIAKASGNPALVQQAERARLELEKLRAVADPLGDKFKSIFEGSFGDALGDFIIGTKSAKEAFKSFADSVVQQISRIAAQNLAQSIFGKAGAGEGIGGFFASLFGGSFAAGGNPPVGVPSLVGERGPELFVPRTAGTILPADKTSKIMQAQPFSYSPTFVLSGPVDRRTQDQLSSAALQGAQRALSRNG